MDLEETLAGVGDGEYVMFLSYVSLSLLSPSRLVSLSRVSAFVRCRVFSYLSRKSLAATLDPGRGVVRTPSVELRPLLGDGGMDRFRVFTASESKHALSAPLHFGDLEEGGYEYALLEVAMTPSARIY